MTKQLWYKSDHTQNMKSTELVQKGMNM